MIKPYNIANEIAKKEEEKRVYLVKVAKLDKEIAELKSKK